ncbi:MAG: class I SAM-dependent methyltransferase [Candidatus Paceibacterota bacterium]|jgi:ubiquinone/menaquinone biosynthesis C-methylase UbiE
MERKNTSWGVAADWYHEHLEKEGTYQKEVVLPNLLRILALKKGMRILDLACGSGFFSRAFAETGAEVIGSDVATRLILIARKESPKNIAFHIAPAHKLDFLPSKSVDLITIIFAAQNIENIDKVFAECARVLKPRGSLVIVMNHPAFRVPKRSGWGWDEEKKTQYRRIDGYMSESMEKIQMHPGDRPDEYTLSFHRPLQVYFKSLRKNGFAVGSLEEWISHKKSEPGTRAAAENEIRKEIPLFLMLQAVRME